jgi:hypothetical protein
MSEPLRCMPMKPFVFQHAQDVWPKGETLLHVYVTPGYQDRELAALVTRAQSVLQDFPIICVEDRWLHRRRAGTSIPAAVSLFRFDGHRWCGGHAANVRMAPASRADRKEARGSEPGRTIGATAPMVRGLVRPLNNAGCLIDKPWSGT